MAFMEIHIKSNMLDMNTTIAVIYPEHHDKNKKIKVLYLLHGYTGHYMDWMRQTSIERYANMYDLCVVMPSVHNSYYTNNIHNVKYFDYVALELPQIIEGMFDVSKKKEDRFVAGLSMGGYGALKIGLTYPKRYEKVASFSGAINVDRLYELNKHLPKSKQFLSAFRKLPIKGTKHDIYYLLDKANQKALVPSLFIACGTEDFLYPDHLDFIKYLKEKNISFIHAENPGNHEWRLWDMYIKDALKWMFE